MCRSTWVSRWVSGMSGSGTATRFAIVVATRRSSPARIGSCPAAAPVMEVISSARVQPLSM